MACLLSRRRGRQRMRDLFPPLPSSSYSVGMTRSEIPLFCWPFSLLAGPACAGAKAQSGAKTIQIGQSQSPIGRCSARHELVHHCRMLLGVFYSWMGLETNLDVGKLANPHVGIPCSDLQCSYLFISAIDVLRLLLILGHNALSTGQFVRRYTPISHLRIPPCESQVVVVYPSGAVRSSMHASVLTLGCRIKTTGWANSSPKLFPAVVPAHHPNHLES